jgi:hypothetical protein
MGEREGFFEDASHIFAMIEAGLIQASVSSLTIINCAYILRKVFDYDSVLNKLGELCRLLEVLPINKQHLLDAIQTHPHDYEDAVQYFSANSFLPDVIITRDKKGFAEFDTPVMTPSEFAERTKTQN